MTGGPRRAAEIARAFCLGADARFTGRVERGEQGRVEQLLTARGAFAVKTSFGEPDLDGEDAAFQAAARAEGVPAPEVVRAAGGAWHAAIGGLPVRVYEWVDLLPVDRGIDPAETGRVVAAIHRTPFVGSRPEDPWYTDPVGPPPGTGSSATWRRRVRRSPPAWPACATTSSPSRRTSRPRPGCARAIATSGPRTCGGRGQAACA
jgi:hypothetical protein